MTAKQNTLAAIRALVDYVKEDEREHYLEVSPTGTGDGHIFESIARIEEWLSGQGQVLYLEAGSDGGSGLPEAFCRILAEQEATKRFEDMLRGEHLPPLPYNPKTDEVQVRFEPTITLGQRFYGFLPLGGVNGDMPDWLSFECQAGFRQWFARI